MINVHQAVTILILLAFLLVISTILHYVLVIFRPQRIAKGSELKTPRSLKPKCEDDCRLWALLAEGVDVSVLERVMGISEGTLRTWLTRAGMHAARLHTTPFQ